MNVFCLFRIHLDEWMVVMQSRKRFFVNKNEHNNVFHCCLMSVLATLHKTVSKICSIAPFGSSCVVVVVVVVDGVVGRVSRREVGTVEG